MRAPTALPERRRGTEELGQEAGGGRKGTGAKTPPEAARRACGTGTEKKEEKQQPRKYPALLSPTCALRAAAAAPSPHALVPHAASAFPHSTAQHSTASPKPPLFPGRRGRGTTPRSPAKSPAPHRVRSPRQPTAAATCGRHLRQPPHAPGPAAAAFPRSAPA